MLLITGAGGQLGRAFRSLLADGDGIFIDEDQLDLEDLSSIEPVLCDLCPDGIINCAAYMELDRAERERPKANTINGLAVGEMARHAARRGIPFITFSSADVFDGRATRPYVECDPVAPVNAYGRSKLLGEQMALDAYPRALVIRTSWLMSSAETNFVSTTVRAVAARETKFADDQRGCPTIAEDLAEATLAALNAEAAGVVHITNAGPTSWYELACEIAKSAGLDVARVRPSKTRPASGMARRPMFCALGTKRLGKLGIMPLPSWKASLPEIVSQLGAGLRVA